MQIYCMPTSSRLIKCKMMTPNMMMLMVISFRRCHGTKRRITTRRNRLQGLENLAAQQNLRKNHIQAHYLRVHNSNNLIKIKGQPRKEAPIAA